MYSIISKRSSASSSCLSSSVIRNLRSPRREENSLVCERERCRERERERERREREREREKREKREEREWRKIVFEQAMWRSGVRELRRNLWAFAGVRSSKSLVAAEAKGGNATGNVFLLACTGIGAGVSAGFLGHIYTSSTSSDRRLSFVDLVTSCSSEASRLLRGCYATRTLSCSQVECAERTYSVEQVLRGIIHMHAKHSFFKISTL